MPKDVDRGFLIAPTDFKTLGIYQQCWLPHCWYEFGPTTLDCFFKMQKVLRMLKIIPTQRTCCFYQYIGERSSTTCAILFLNQAGAAWQQEYCWSVYQIILELIIPDAWWGLTAGKEHLWLSKVESIFTNAAVQLLLQAQPPKIYESPLFTQLDMPKASSLGPQMQDQGAVLWYFQE